MRIGFLIILLCLVLPSCKQTRIDIRHPEKNGRIILSIERTPCFGACPVYTATLYENGLLIYNGKRFTHSIGCHFAVIPASEVKKLRTWLEDDGIFLFKDKYPEEDVAPTDLSSCLLFYSKGNKEKRIVDRGWETPETLQSIENKIENWLSVQNLQFCDK